MRQVHATTILRRMFLHVQVYILLRMFIYFLLTFLNLARAIGKIHYVSYSPEEIIGL